MLTYGLTLDDISGYEHVVDKLRTLKQRITVRIVLDEFAKPEDYVDAMKAISKHADIMAAICDSQFVHLFLEDQYLERTKRFHAVLHEWVKYWEFANEANGDWVGKGGPKFLASYLYLNSQEALTALCLYQDETESWERWVLDMVPYCEGVGIDLVLMSCYPHDNDGYEVGKGGWQGVFDRLGHLFPTAKLGIGECGMDPESFDYGKRSACFRHFYTEIPNRVVHDRFIGGFFHWYMADFFGEDPRLWSQYAGLFKQ